MQQLTNHSQPLFFSKRIISHWDFSFVFSCLFFLAAGFAVFVATIFWIFVPIAGIGVQLLANSLSLIMAHSTTPSLSSAEPTRPGLQQRSLTNALVSISFNINLSKISLSLSLRVKVCQPTKAWCSSKDDCLLEPRLSSSSQRGDYLQVRCWTTLQQVYMNVYMDIFFHLVHPYHILIRKLPIIQTYFSAGLCLTSPWTVTSWHVRETIFSQPQTGQLAHTVRLNSESFFLIAIWTCSDKFCPNPFLAETDNITSTKATPTKTEFNFTIL